MKSLKVFESHQAPMSLPVDATVHQGGPAASFAIVPLIDTVDVAPQAGTDTAGVASDVVTDTVDVPDAVTDTAEVVQEAVVLVTGMASEAVVSADSAVKE